MILDQIAGAAKYESLHPLFARAFHFLHSRRFESLADGRHDLLGDDLFALVARTAGKGRDQAKLEYHRRYIDIQYVDLGPDTMGWRPLSDCHVEREPYDATRDLGFFDDTPVAWIQVPAGCFTIFFPSDAHAPLAGEQQVNKVVLKIAVSV